VGERQRRDQVGGLDLLASGAEHEDHDERGGLPRWVWRVAGLLVLGLVAVVAGPQLLSSRVAGQQQQASPLRSPAATAPLVRPISPRVVPPLRWGPRGPEVGSDFVVAALARLREERHGVDRLLWAGSLDGHDHVVVFTYRRQPNLFYTDSIEVAALRVRHLRDLPTAHGETIGYVRSADELVGLAWQGADQHTRLLVLARPRPRLVQVSSYVDYDVVGRVSRRWSDATLDDGVLVTDLGRNAEPVILVRPDNVSSRTKITSPIIVEVHGRPSPPRVAAADPAAGNLY
jgi:hypothetical protein